VRPERVSSMRRELLEWLGGEHKTLGRAHVKRNRRAGYWYIHNVIDDCTRLGYSELLADEKQKTAVGFWHAPRPTTKPPASPFDVS
jgi:hypothetical protein